MCFLVSEGKCSLGFKKISFSPFKLLSFFWSFGSVRNKMSFWWQDRPSRELSWSELNWKRNCLLMTSFHDCIFLLFSSDNCFYIFIFKVDSFFSMYGVVKKTATDIVTWRFFTRILFRLFGRGGGFGGSPKHKAKSHLLWTKLKHLKFYPKSKLCLAHHKKKLGHSPVSVRFSMDVVSRLSSSPSSIFSDSSLMFILKEKKLSEDVKTWHKWPENKKWMNDKTWPMYVM